MLRLIFILWIIWSLCRPRHYGTFWHTGGWYRRPPMGRNPWTGGWHRPPTGGFGGGFGRSPMGGFGGGFGGGGHTMGGGAGRGRR